jgi:hypothetical protein
MGLPKEWAEKLDAMVERETVTMPMGLTVVVRGLTIGDSQRASAHQRGTEMLIALATDRAEGGQMWDPNNADDLNEIAKLPMEDGMAILNVLNRLSGVGEAGNGSSPQIVSLSSPSPA